MCVWLFIYPGHSSISRCIMWPANQPVILFLSYPSWGPHISIFLLAWSIALQSSLLTLLLVKFVPLQVARFKVCSVVYIRVVDDYDVIAHLLKQWCHRANLFELHSLLPSEEVATAYFRSSLREWCNISDSWIFCQTWIANLFYRVWKAVLVEIRSAVPSDENFYKANVLPLS